MRRIISRRDLLYGAALLGVPMAAALLDPDSAKADVSESEKISQVDAKYQATPNAQQRCEICLQFEPPDHCKIVRAPISPKGWCQYFAAKENAH